LKLLVSLNFHSVVIWYCYSYVWLTKFFILKNFLILFNLSKVLSRGEMVSKPHYRRPGGWETMLYVIKNSVRLISTLRNFYLFNLSNFRALKILQVTTLTPKWFVTSAVISTKTSSWPTKAWPSPKSLRRTASRTESAKNWKFAMTNRRRTSQMELTMIQALLRTTKIRYRKIELNWTRITHGEFCIDMLQE